MKLYGLIVFRWFGLGEPMPLRLSLDLWDHPGGYFQRP